MSTFLHAPNGIQYVGKTKRQLRFIHRADPKSAVACHFADGNHSVSHLVFCGIDIMIPNRRGGNMNTILLQGECRYIFYLKMLHPSGLN